MNCINNCMRSKFITLHGIEGGRGLEANALFYCEMVYGEGLMQ